MDGLLAAAGSDLGAFLDHWTFFALIGAMAAGLAGALGKGAGFGNLFRDDRRLFDPQAGSAIKRLWASPAFWSHVGLTLLFAGAYLIAFDAPDCAPRCGWGPGAEARLLGYVGAAGLGFVLLGRRAVRATRVDGAKPPEAEVRAEMARRWTGFAVGLVAAWLAWLAAGAIPQNLMAGLPAAWRDVWSAELPWLYVFAAAGVAATLGPRQILPCLSLTALVAVLILFGGVIARLDGGRAEGVAIALVLWVAFANGARFKLRIPGLRDDKAEDPDATVYDRAPGDMPNPNDPRPAPVREGVIDPLEPLNAWLAAERAAKGFGHRPRLALLCTSGGAYRASFWTALLLDHFAAESGPGGRYEGLTGSIRLVTGASGGMVAGAYFVAMAAEGRGGSVTAALEADILAAQEGPPETRRAIPIPRDSLTPVARQMVRGDLPAILRRGRPKTDRGRALEAQWTTLKRSFRSLVEAERAGRAPSIIVSPMLIESGAPAFLIDIRMDAVAEVEDMPGATPVAGEHASDLALDGLG